MSTIRTRISYSAAPSTLTFTEEHPGGGCMRDDVPSNRFEGAASDEGHRRTGISYEYRRGLRTFGV